MTETTPDPFQRHRGLLFTVAYELLGSVADAEDVVQDTWLRWSAADRSDVLEPKAYLVRIATRLALNRLRTLRNRRETYVGPWLPEPLATGPDASGGVELAEDVSMAMLVVLETLTPIERAVFVLREVFGFAHAEIATALDRSEASVRQVAHRAREHVQARRPRFDTDPEQRRAVTERFLRATAEGDLAELLEVLAPDVVMVNDTDGKARAALRPIFGRDKVARLLVGPLVRRELAGYRFEYAELNGEPGVVGVLNGRVDVAGLIETRGGQVVRLLAFRNPDRLTGLRRNWR
ncbi:RNA polymerase sigma-70 factor [Jiangella alkaliphila]|uniref:RNA polymerase sigma-70 factor, ECF subfamily n=1 Tax=Jiangella alkaliphila TaxID=419479 RepID=A0A1H2HSC4_9ACTN|nr:RNA polymerase sigma-70 factor [Jiangella alkaliphila]SDU34781.1 RNA polymerase sigma-70 factor, ECF subfamily [Jiangella alkaliphila]